MTYSSYITYKPKAFVDSSTLLLLAFSTAFFPRLLDTIGFPAAVNFLHFLFVPLACCWVIAQAPNRDRTQIATAKVLISSLCTLLTVMIASAILNSAGLINVAVSYIILTEPFLFLFALVWTPMTKQTLERFKKWIVRFACFHIVLAFAQKLLIDFGVLKLTAGTRLGLPQDNIQGVFYISGGGHVVSSCVSVSFALYYLIVVKTAPLWLRVSVAVAAITQNIVAETKQVTFVCLVAFVLLSFTRIKDLRKFIQYVIAAGIVVFTFLWCMNNIPAFNGYNTWTDLALYGPQGEATQLKTASSRIILDHFDSPLNWLFGIGPGHTVSRLGGWMLERYKDLLLPLGATTSSVASETWDVVWTSRLGPRSSMFSPLFGWMGIWGDVGVLGLGTYLFTGYTIWHQFCKDDFSRYLMLTVILHGFIFTQLEEPGYMMFVAVLIGLRWHELRTGIYS